MSDWGGALLSDDPRWQFGTPPTGNANYAWVQHMIYHLSGSGRAGFVLSNGSMSTNTSSEGDIRRAIVQADLVDCMVALPPQLFYNTQIPACLWFINRRKPAHRRGQTLFIDARSMGYLVNRTLRDLSDDEIGRIAGTYHNWRTGEGELRGRAGLLQERGAGRDRRAWLRADAGALRGRSGRGGRRRAVRGEDGAADGDAQRAVRGIGAIGEYHKRKSAEIGL